MNTIRDIILILITATLISTVSLANETDDIIRVKSSHSVSETINRLETLLKKKGMTIFTRVNHATGAKKVGLELRPTELLIFGNPKIGTLLMQCSQITAIDLPQKALAYEDELGQVWLAYNNPAYITARHNMKECGDAVQKISSALAHFSKMATE